MGQARQTGVGGYRAAMGAAMGQAMQTGGGAIGLLWGWLWGSCGAAMGQAGLLTLSPSLAAGPASTRLQTPPRPRGQRPEPQSCGAPPGPGSSFQVAFGLGALPFAFLSAHPLPPPATGDAGAPPPSSWPDSLFLLVAAFFFLWLLSV
ncbi:E3 ubiquitin-protein ligase RNF5 isoform X2 [Struthio camelus]|uniref:E3 ubiquitin-protein ligase RNF5 isoform X2 n=1 Tax=Struthio camelus TaxID=8801 RepID=UPI003603BEB0